MVKICWCVAWGAALLLLAQPLSAQAVGLDYVVTRAGYEEVLDTPKGFSLFAETPIIDELALRLTVSRRTESHVRTGPTCTGLIAPDQECPTDTMDGDSRLTAASLGVAYAPLLDSRLTPEVFGAATLISVESSFKGRETGREIGPITPEGLTPGLAFGAGARYQLSGPFAANLRAQYEIQSFSECGADAWFAFCENRNFWSVSLGLAWSPAGWPQG